MTSASPDLVDGPSQIIPPTSDASTAAFSVPACPGTAADALPVTTAQHCEVQSFEFAPPTSVPARSAGTVHHTHLSLDSSQVPGSSQLFNNHLAVDPVLSGALAITKTTPSLSVSRGQLVPYEIKVRNTLAVPLTDLEIVDRFPAGFRYVPGSGRIDGVAIEPTVDGRELVFSNLTVPASGESTVALLLAVGAGVTDGNYANRAQARSGLTGLSFSGEATATVRLTPDPDLACTDVMGKVFDDKNQNRLQEEGELGLAGVRVVTARGLAATTDAHGRYHITCAATPNEARGSNFVLKLDDRSLPSGYRMSTRKLQIKRATAGKALRFNFGASVHRVVGLDMADAVFEPGSTDMRDQWIPRLKILVDELSKAPSILRLSYVADVESKELVEDRLDAIEDRIEDLWKDLDAYELTIEPQVYWRRGAPREDR